MSSAAYDFLMYSGYVTMAYFWGLMALKAAEKLKKGGAESPEFYRTKLETADFYFHRILPRAKAHADAMVSPTSSVMQTPIDNFQFA